jgi:hypothetical protein
MTGQVYVYKRFIYPDSRTLSDEDPRKNKLILSAASQTVFVVANSSVRPLQRGRGSCFAQMWSIPEIIQLSTFRRLIRRHLADYFPSHNPKVGGSAGCFTTSTKPVLNFPVASAE